MTKRQMRRVREIAKNITLMMIVVVMFCWCSWYETHYTREATVIDVTDNIITVVDKCDYTWSFEGDGFNINDEVKLMMNTMHTDSNIFDDEIEDVKMINKKKGNEYHEDTIHNKGSVQQSKEVLRCLSIRMVL